MTRDDVSAAPRGESGGENGAGKGGDRPTDGRCAHVRDDGSRCGTTFGLCDCHGKCFSHAPCRADELREAQRRGGISAHRADGSLDADDLPPLRGPRDAEAWLAALATARVEGRITTSLSAEVRKVLKAWLDAHDAGRVSDRLDALTDALAKWRETGDPSPVLELVEGGGS